MSVDIAVPELAVTFLLASRNDLLASFSLVFQGLHEMGRMK